MKPTYASLPAFGLVFALLFSPTVHAAGDKTSDAAKPTTVAQAQPPAANKSGAAPATRDWSAVDANGDHLVSPEEMEAYLKANPGPLKQ